MSTKKALVVCLLFATVFSQIYLPKATFPGLSGYNLGFAIGQQFHQQIQNFVESNDDLTALELWATTSGSDLYNQIIANQNKFYPNYYQELQGLAAGAEVDEMKIMLNNIVADLAQYFEHVNDTQTITPRIRCSDVLLSSPGASVHGHNEDDGSVYAKLNYLVETDNWVAYTYAAELPGNAFAWNPSHSLTYTMNSLFPYVTNLEGACQYFIMRDVIESTSTEDAKNRALKYPAFSGFSLNVADATTKLNIEVSAQPSETSGQTNAVTEATTGVPLAHFNNYEQLDVLATNDTSSVYRMQTFTAMIGTGSILDAEGVAHFLGNTTNANYPVFRRQSVWTLATMITDWDQNTIEIYTDNPVTSSPTYTYTMPPSQ